MRILLLAMPDAISALAVVTQMPNLGICSLAGNVKGHDVKIADLVFHKHGLKKYVRDILRDFKPDIVGLSAMSHQYASACTVSSICREEKPGAKIILGGYHATLMHKEIGAGPDAKLFDFIVRGEGELTFRSLVEEIGSGKNTFDGVAGLSYRKDASFYHNPDAPLLELDKIGLPDRDCRIIDKAQFMGQPFDCVETSRGCSMDCHFCSVSMMYGRSFRTFSLERIISDLKNLKQKGKTGAFFVDDNITLDVQRLKRLCASIISAELNDMSFGVQASVPGIVSDPGLAERLGKAGFKWVFLGIENGISRNLNSMGKKGVLNNSRQAVELLKSQGIVIFGGFIIGNPQDTREDVLSTFKYALEIGVDHPIIQCLTPYPKTLTRQELLELDLVTNKSDFSRYNGFTCNVRTGHLSTRQLNSAALWGGLRLYFHPRYIARSRFWRFKLSMIPGLIMNNFRYLAGAITGKIFMSDHRW